MTVACSLRVKVFRTVAQTLLTADIAFGRQVLEVTMSRLCSPTMPCRLAHASMVANWEGRGYFHARRWTSWRATISGRSADRALAMASGSATRCDW
jgi:hypothetical protein